MATARLLFLVTLVARTTVRGQESVLCEDVFRNTNLPCMCLMDIAKNGTSVNCDHVAFFGDFPLLPYQQRIVGFSQRYAGVQNLEAQLFTASNIPLKTVDFSHNLIRRLTERVFDGIQDTLEELYLQSNQLGDQLNPIFSTSEFHQLANLKILDLSSNGLKAMDTSLFNGLNNLKELHLEKNELLDVPSMSLRNLASLSTLHLQENAIQKIPSNAFPEMRNLKVLNVSANNIQTVEDQAFVNLAQLETLILSYSRLQTLPSDSLSGLPKLEFLDLSNNFFSQVPIRGLMKLKGLKKLVLHSNKIQSLEGTPFSDFKNLQHLDLSRNGISTISQSTFLGASSLLELHLDVNNLRRLNVDSFYGLDNIEILSLSDNQMLPFPTEVLEGLKRLKKLNLDYNRIAEISASIFETVRQLEELSLSFNLIKEIPDGSFQNFRNLQLLNLYGNKIEKLSFSKLSGIERSLLFLDLGNNDIRQLPKLAFPNLQIISLAKNLLASLQPDTFELLPELRYLNLSYNYITELPSGVFSPLQNIHMLDLESNHLLDLPANMFTNLSLNSINLKNNKLKELESRTFYKLQNLQKIDLSHNLLTSIRSIAFDNLPSLTTLSLNNNGMSSFKGDMFGGKTSLKTIELANNQITYLYPNSFSIHPTLKKINLAGNKLTFFPSEIVGSLNTLQSINLCNNRLQSLEDADFANMPALRELDLRDNMISKVGERAFQNSSHLHWINLWNNNISSIQEKTFRGISRLNLNLGRNNLTGLPHEIFSRINVFKLESINLAYNQLPDFPTGALKRQFSFLERVDLSFNKISNLPSNADALVNVKQLDLSGNPLTYEAHLILLSEPKSIRSLNIAGTNLKFIPLIESPFLKILNLSNNGIAGAASDSFQKTTHLHTLDISGNIVMKIKPAFGQSWVQLPNLKRLDLSRNPIKTILAGDFAHLGNLEDLRLSELNELTRVDCDSFHGLKNLRNIHLDNYPILSHLNLEDCLHGFDALTSLKAEVKDNQLSEQLQRIYSPRLNMLQISGSNLKTLSSGAFTGLQHASLDISITDTAISVLPLTVFLPLPLSSKVSLNVSGNGISSITSQLLAVLDSKQNDITIKGLDNNPITCDCHLHGFWQWMKDKEEETSENVFHSFVCHQPQHLKGRLVSSLNDNELTCSDSGQPPSTTTSTTSTTTTVRTSTRREPDIIFEVAATTSRPVRKNLAAAGSSKSALTKVDTMIIGIVAGVVAFVCILIIVICIVRLRRARPHYTAGPLAGPLALRAQGNCTCLKPPPNSCTCYPPYPHPMGYSTLSQQKMLMPPMGTLGRPMTLKNTPYYVTFPDSDNDIR